MLGFLLLAIDRFGLPIAFSHGGKDRVKSRFGGLCSILLLAFAVFVLYQGCLELTANSYPIAFSIAPPRGSSGYPELLDDTYYISDHHRDY